MVNMGFEPAAAGWRAQTKPWSYGGRHLLIVFTDLYHIWSFKYYFEFLLVFLSSGLSNLTPTKFQSFELEENMLAVPT